LSFTHRLAVKLDIELWSRGLLRPVFRKEGSLWFLPKTQSISAHAEFYPEPKFRDSSASRSLPERSRRARRQNDKQRARNDSNL